MKKVLFFLLVIGSFGSALGQSGNYQLPKVLMPSPEAQNFLRYGEIPVDYSTGVPNISIPIYTVKSRKLQFPITATYHAAGIKVGDQASLIGLGWVLNIRGMLSITVLNGMNKFDTINRPTYKTAQEFATARGIAGNNNGDSELLFANLIDLQAQSRDWQSERYDFQIPTGLSGTFRYNFLTGDLLKLPFDAYKIKRQYGIYSGITDSVTIGFVITGDNGDSYTFGYPAGGPAYTYCFQSMDLLSIISADKTDTIKFVYKSGVNNNYENTAFGSSLDLGDDAYADQTQPGTGPNYTASATFSRVTNRNPVSERILDSIITATTLIKITSPSDRLDFGWHTGKFRISKLEMYDRYSGKVINEVNFNHSYFGSQANNNRRLRLDSISLKGTSSSIYSSYKFDYDTTIQLPPRPENDSTFNVLLREDYWGYYNGSGSFSKIPQEFLPDSFISSYTGRTAVVPYGSGTDRNPNHYYAKAALIKSIKYPTGGITVFDFEPNQAADAYSYPNQQVSNTIVGGFRILRIRNYTDSGKLAETKTYKYSMGKTRTITSDLFSYSQRVYKEVTVPPMIGYSSPTWKTSTYHTIFTSNSFLPLICENGPPVFYEKVTEYLGDTLVNIGKTEYTYQIPEANVYASSDHPRFQSSLEQDRGSYKPLLSSAVQFKSEGGQYYPVEKTLNTYSKYKAEFYPTGLNLVHTSSYPTGFGIENVGTGWYDSYFTTLGTVNYFFAFDLKASQMTNFLSRSDVTRYGKDTTQQLVTSTIYKYDTLTHLQPVEQIVINSTGDSLKTKYKYPKDYAGTAVYDSMVARNIVTSLIEQSGYRNSSFLQSSKTNYYSWNTAFIAPQTIESKTLTNSTETRLRFNAYDPQGNTLSVSKENDIKVSYIWNYNNLYPIAEVLNADTGQIAYSSFEADGRGKWNYNATTETDYSTITGNKIYRLTGSNNITKSGLSSSTTYIVSYWTTKGSAYTITGTIYGYPIGGRTINGWKYFEHRVTGQTTITLTGTGTIDELRLYPVNAQMSTYTYEPSVGIKSKCDANGRTLYYEYDYLNRLVAIRDQDNNVVKKICYNYAGQPENCNFYSNTYQGGYYYSQLCTNGETPLAYWADVQAGTYTSAVSVDEANAKALNYLQQQANLNGTCQQTVVLTGSTNASSYCYQVELWNPSTGYDVWFDLVNGTHTLGNIPPGTYEVYFYSSGCDNGVSRNYTAGCGNSTSNSNGAATLSNVVINSSCKTIGVY